MTRPVQEPDVVPAGVLVAVGVAAIAVTLGCLLWVALVMRPLERADLGPAAAPAAARPGPAGPPVDRALFRERGFASARLAQQRARLESYGRVAGADGFVRIPIERAMQLVAAGRTP